ncbi:hypothetical protein Tco_0881570 [Tanacetum coccineum]
MFLLDYNQNPVEAALQAPPSPDYVPGPEEPEQALPSPDYVPGPEHADDEIVAEDQPYAEDASPTAQSPDYVPKSNPEANPEEDDDEDLEEDPVNYPADGGDDGVERPQSCGGRLSRSRGLTKVADFSPIFTPPSITTLTMVFTTFPRIHSPPYPCFTSPSLPLSPPSPVLSSTPPPSPIHSLGYRAAMILLRAKVASTSHSLPLPPPFILSPTISDAPSSGIPPPCPYQYEVGESSSAAIARPARGLRADYGFVATMDREIRCDLKRERLDYPKRLGGDQWMREILPTERLCHCVLSYWVRSAAYTDIDSDAVITGKGNHTTGTGGSTTWIGYRTAGTTGTRWRSCIARAARGGWNEMKKLEAKLWNLKVKGTDVIGYNQRFQELALLCVRMFPEESDKIERYVGGLHDMIYGNIVASKPKIMQEAVEMATELMDKKVSTIAERQG